MSALRVFPAPDAPAAGPAGGGGGKSIPMNKKTLLMGGGAAVVVVLGLVAAKGNSEDATEEEGSGTGYELDTRDTDLYNELQPELERIGDAIEDWTRPPKPGTPNPQTPNPNGPGPKPGNPGIRRTYRVQKGDTLAGIARKLKVRGGRARLYAVNRRIIERAARSHGRKTSMGGKYIYSGTVLAIPA